MTDQTPEARLAAALEREMDMHAPFDDGMQCDCGWRVFDDGHKTFNAHVAAECAADPTLAADLALAAAVRGAIVQNTSIIAAIEAAKEASE